MILFFCLSCKRCCISHKAGDWFSALTEGDIVALESFAAAGGVVTVFGSHNSFDLNLLNGVFDG